MNEIVGKHTQDKEERVRIVWDDGIGKDSMRVTAACADDPQDTKPMDYRTPAYEIYCIAEIVRMDAAFTLSVAERALFFVDFEGFHTGIKERFC